MYKSMSLEVEGRCRVCREIGAKWYNDMCDVENPRKTQEPQNQDALCETAGPDSDLLAPLILSLVERSAEEACFLPRSTFFVLFRMNSLISPTSGREYRW